METKLSGWEEKIFRAILTIWRTNWAVKTSDRSLMKKLRISWLRSNNTRKEDRCWQLIKQLPYWEAISIESSKASYNLSKKCKDSHKSKVQIRTKEWSRRVRMETWRRPPKLRSGSKGETLGMELQWMEEPSPSIGGHSTQLLTKYSSRGKRLRGMGQASTMINRPTMHWVEEGNSETVSTRQEARIPTLKRST